MLLVRRIPSDSFPPQLSELSSVFRSNAGGGWIGGRAGTDEADRGGGEVDLLQRLVRELGVAQAMGDEESAMGGPTARPKDAVGSGPSVSQEQRQRILER